MYQDLGLRGNLFGGPSQEVLIYPLTLKYIKSLPYKYQL